MAYTRCPLRLHIVPGGPPGLAWDSLPPPTDLATAALARTPSLTSPACTHVHKYAAQHTADSTVHVAAHDDFLPPASAVTKQPGVGPADLSLAKTSTMRLAGGGWNDRA
ncbi:uncharacterized protein FIBRA_09067 [Fibroporia radiculosa]|uniref:Uncharacterized protein n=1 Tax=Fibroporia radiculosa TaxID=599839 RepID=J4H5H9_9APHY|nr:uncharacterized protein FIBRA_09067 [Fibroporia radiculosa]CCM06769.1 predicted protein [Fibroporia radiculosa]